MQSHKEHGIQLQNRQQKARVNQTRRLNINAKIEMRERKTQ